MPRECTVCAHAARATLELGLANRVGVRVLAARHGVSKEALQRHRKNHMPPQLLAQLLTKGRQSPIDLENLRQTESEGLLQHLVAVRGRLYKIADDCEDKGDMAGAVRALNALHNNAELVAKLLGDLRTGSQTITQNILIHPGYHQVRTKLIAALRPYPEVHRAIAEVLHNIEGELAPAIEATAH